MKYPSSNPVLLDVTKPPYNADNTGKSDCTKALVSALDDALRDYIDEMEKTNAKLMELSENLTRDVYINRESARVVDGVMLQTLPEFLPESRIIYLPAGTYLISDTIGYSLTDLWTQQQVNYTCELCRNIHIMGESAETTVIRLRDNAPGFDLVKKVIDFNPKGSLESVSENTNCAQMNTLEDLTVDVGSGNPGAVGVFYVSSNCGRMENLIVKGESGHCGIAFDIGSEGVFRNIKVSGFDTGITVNRSSPCLFEEIDVSECKRSGLFCDNSALVLNRYRHGNITGVDFPVSKQDRHSDRDVDHGGVVCHRVFTYDNALTFAGDGFVYHADEHTLLSYRPVPVNPRTNAPEDCVCVDDFGAVGDGKTDSTRAIQRAMDSGKPVVLFGRGDYLITEQIHIPKTVQTVDFMYCNLFAGTCLITGEVDAAFEIAEDADMTLYMENLFSHEQFFGYFRCIKHAAKRDLVLRNFAPFFCAMYFNTVSGSNVWIDNAFQTMATYSQDLILSRRGYKPVFCGVIPFEFHGQRVWANNLNPERADVHILNDHSEVYINGYKTEGPGVAVRSVNGGKTQINVFNNGIWQSKIENALFEITDSDLDVCGGLVFFFNEDPKYCTALDCDGERTCLYDLAGDVGRNFRHIERIEKYAKTE